MPPTVIATITLSDEDEMPVRKGPQKRKLSLSDTDLEDGPSTSAAAFAKTLFKFPKIQPIQIKKGCIVKKKETVTQKAINSISSPTQRDLDYSDTSSDEE